MKQMNLFLSLSREEYKNRYNYDYFFDFYGFSSYWGW